MYKGRKNIIERELSPGIKRNAFYVEEKYMNEKPNSRKKYIRSGEHTVYYRERTSHLIKAETVVF